MTAVDDISRFLHRRRTAHRNAGDPLEVVNPADGRAFAEVAAAAASDVDAAVEAAGNAFTTWSELAVSKRGEILGRAARHVEEHLDELIPLLTREQGKTLRDSPDRGHQGGRHADALRRSVEGAPWRAHPEPRSRRRRNGSQTAARRRRGDHPLEFPADADGQQARPGDGRRQHPGRQAGDDDPAHHATVGRIDGRRGPPRGVQRGDRPRLEAGEEIIRTRWPARSGSPARPRGRASGAGAHESSTSPSSLAGRTLIVCDDADLDQGEPGSIGRFFNSGQACLAIKRVYVFENVADDSSTRSSRGQSG